MARNEAFREAERKIKEAGQSGERSLDLSVFSYRKDLPKLTELPEALGELSQLRELSLKGNEITELPDCMGKLTQLQVLELNRNQLTALPEWLGKLSQLQSLNLSNNKISILSERLGQLSQLRSLDLSYNPLTILPEWVGQLTRLEVLRLEDTKIKVPPESLGLLTQLQQLDLSNNPSIVLPEWLGRLPQLSSLKLTYNQLNELPECLRLLPQLRDLDLTGNELTALPDWFGELNQLNTLDLTHNQLRTFPEFMGRLTNLRELILSANDLRVLPDSMRGLVGLGRLDVESNRLCDLPIWLADLKHLSVLYLGSPLGSNPFIALPAVIRDLKQLQRLYVTGCQFDSVPDWLGELKNLSVLQLEGNRLKDLPTSLGGLGRLVDIELKNNPLNPELDAAYKEGLDAVKRYLRAKSEAQVVLNEAKLILIGEGEVGKSCLLGALRDDPWEEGRATTHGIEIKPFKVTDPTSGTEITLNGWDFGGQRVYRPTHQLFFSSPAVYLVVWKPREGPQQGFVKEWITLVRHREPDAKILVVATHGGPRERQPDIDRQEIWDLFGKSMVLDFFLVDSKPDEKTKESSGIAALKQAIARAAVSLPEMGRKVPRRWEETRQALKKTDVAYLPISQVLKLCRDRKMDENEAMDFLRISHRLGHLIYYEHDPLLQDVVVLKPDWLSTAISFVLDDRQTRDGHGLVEYARLSQLWSDPTRPEESRYPSSLHPLFLRLMERFDLSYKVAIPSEPEDAMGFWQRVRNALGTGRTKASNAPDLHYTSLIAQLVPDVRPLESELHIVWPLAASDGDEEQMQICRIVDTKSGQSAAAEGLFFQLIVRLHKYSLGRVNYKESVHWQRGLVLDDDYNGRALLEHVGNDVRIAVRAPYPERFLSVLTHEVKWLVESFWAGMRCDVMVPCMDPCGKGVPGTGLFEVEKLIAFKKQDMQLFPCFVSGCNQAQDINRLLRNAPAARRTSIEALLAEGLGEVKLRLDGVRDQLVHQDREALNRFSVLDRKIAAS